MRRFYDIQRDSFRKYVSSVFHIGFKIPRSDQCNDCGIFYILIKQERNRMKKKELKKLKRNILWMQTYVKKQIKRHFKRNNKQKSCGLSKRIITSLGFGRVKLKKHINIETLRIVQEDYYLPWSWKG